MILDLADVIAALGGIGFVILIIVIAIILVVFALQIGIRAVKGEDTGLGPVFLTGLIMIVISAVISTAFGYLTIQPLIGSIVSLLVNLFIIKARHKTTYLGALGALVIYVVMVVIIFVVLSLVFAGFIAALLAIFP